MPAGRDEGVGVGALRAADRHAGQIDAVEDVGVDQLGREVEGQQVEVGRGPVGVDTEEGQLAAAHLRFHVDPGRVRALGHRVGTLVQDLVEDLEALVGQADLVGVGIDQQPRRLVGRVDRVLGAVFAADVPGWLADLAQQRLDPRPERGHLATQCTGAPPADSRL